MFNLLVSISRRIRPSCRAGCAGRSMMQMAVTTYGLLGALGYIMSTDPKCQGEHPSR